MTQPDPIRRAMTEIAEEIISNKLGDFPRELVNTTGAKRIAEEVAEKVFDEKMKCHSFIPGTNEVNAIKAQRIAEKVTNVRNALNRKGEHWDQTENDLLFQELNVAVDTIAANHGRTGNAIRMQIKRLRILYNFVS